MNLCCDHIHIQLVIKELSDWPVVPMTWKDEWKSVMITSGALFVIKDGVLRTPGWRAGNLDFLAAATVSQHGWPRGRDVAPYVMYPRSGDCVH